MAKKEKRSKSKTNKTVTTVTVTVETKQEHDPSYNMPVDRNDFESTKFYKANGVPVSSVYGTGRKQFFAYVPDEDYANASDEEKAEIKKKAAEFSKKVDNMRRTDARKYKKVIEHENVSMDGLLESGYDPSIDSIDVAIKITSRIDEAEEAEQFKTDDDWSYNGSQKSRGAYSSDGDLTNPEYLVARQQLWDKLHELVDELEGEEKAIIDMILEDKSVAQKAKELHMAKSTLNDHKNDLFARLREALKDYR